MNSSGSCRYCLNALAVSGDALYRSTDGGSQWLRLAGGLPQGMDSQWVVAFSPTYSLDGVIFAPGDRRPN